jgi:heme oxygenase
MTTLELKSSIVHQIDEINDIGFLKALKKVLDSKLNKETLNLTEEQKRDIVDSQNQVSEGQYTYHSDVMKELEEWLNEK